MIPTKKISRSSRYTPQGFLSWFSGAVFEQKEIRSFISIGRDESQVIILNNDPFISRRHARIEAYPGKGGYVLKDMSSRNGTFLNGSKVYQALLKENDRIQIGKTEFIFSSKRFRYDWKLFHQSLNLKWNQQLEKLPSIAQSDFPVLILGPSGTGKENIAHIVHSHSKRRMGPYVSINCSALTETLAESEFFGHKKGSFTGAEAHRKGAFMAAHGGTLFLDEIGDLPLTLQPKLLRAIEYQEIKPVGCDQTTKVDVRIVAATHQDLKQKVADKTFREDLYFRLKVLEVYPPALRDRMEDFERLLDFFSAQMGIPFSKNAKKQLQKYSWPGNIRELKHVVVRAKALFPNHEIQPEHIDEILHSKYQPSPRPSHTSQTPDSSPILKQMEKAYLIRVLKESKGNQKKAASMLHIPRSTLITKLNLFGLDSKTYRQE